MTVGLVDCDPGRRVHSNRIDKIDLVLDEIDLPKHPIRKARPITRAHSGHKHARNNQRKNRARSNPGRNWLSFAHLRQQTSDRARQYAAKTENGVR